MFYPLVDLSGPPDAGAVTDPLRPWAWSCLFRDTDSNRAAIYCGLSILSQPFAATLGFSCPCVVWFGFKPVSCESRSSFVYSIFEL